MVLGAGQDKAAPARAALLPCAPACPWPTGLWSMSWPQSSPLVNETPPSQAKGMLSTSLQKGACERSQLLHRRPQTWVLCQGLRTVSGAPKDPHTSQWMNYNVTYDRGTGLCSCGVESQFSHMPPCGEKWRFRGAGSLSEVTQLASHAHNSTEHGVTKPGLLLR